jgi:hypothetical protein
MPLIRSTNDLHIKPNQLSAHPIPVLTIFPIQWQDGSSFGAHVRKYPITRLESAKILHFQLLIEIKALFLKRQTPS